MREVYLSNLPKRGKYIDWVKCSKQKLKIGFIYDDIKGFLHIIDYDSKRHKLKVKYLGNDFHEISTDSVLKCTLGNLLNRHTKDFKIQIGQIFKNEKRDLIITDRKYIVDKSRRNRKLYKYACNSCGWTDGWVEESQLLGYTKAGCSCCRGLTVVQGINDIATTNPDLVEYFKYPNEAKIYPKGTHRKIVVICPDCSREKSISLNNLRWQGLNCSCSDGKPYGEKLILNMYNQLSIDFEIEYSPKWARPKRYDFYINLNDIGYIVEIHGKQHYKKQTGNFKRTLEEEQENDRIKKQLALKNGIKEENYIVIDCRKSELEWIKQNILKSKINELFDLSKINWNRCEEFACKNLVKIACKLKRDNPDLRASEIAKLINLSVDTIKNYFKQGVRLGWCEYNPREEMKKSGLNQGKANSMQVGVFDFNGNLIKKFYSACECERQSEMLFGVKFLQGSVSRVCRGERNHHKGYKFKYIKE